MGIKNLAVTLDAKGEAPFKLGTVGVPTTLLINREGQEIGRLIGAAEWDRPRMVEFLKATIAKAPSNSRHLRRRRNPNDKLEYERTFPALTGKRRACGFARLGGPPRWGF